MPPNTNAIKGKKRKRTKGEVMEAVVSKLMKTVTEEMKESDKMFMELEEKQMKFEEQQRREERQFQLEMMQMLLGSSNPPPTHTNSQPQFFPTFPPYGDPYFNSHGDNADSS